MRELLTPLIDKEITRQYEKTWDFTDQPASFPLNLTTVTAGANANDEVAATVVGIIPTACKLLGGYYSTSANSGGVDGSNTVAFNVAVGGIAALSATRTTNTVLDTPYTLGTPLIADLAAGSSVTIALVTGSTADMNSAVVSTTLKLADAANYPAPGLKLISTDGGTATISDGIKGILTLTTGATDNSEFYLATSTELFKMAADTNFKASCLLQFTNTNTTDNLFFGFMNAAAANALVDTGGGPKATGDYVGMWLVDGVAHYYAGVQSNGTAVPAADALGIPNTTGGGSDYHLLEVEWFGLSSTQGKATMKVDGVVIASIDHAYASATEMQAVLGAKTGEAVDFTVNIDTLGYAGNRP
jgi:hypothetical protein